MAPSGNPSSGQVQASFLPLRKVSRPPASLVNGSIAEEIDEEKVPDMPSDEPPAERRKEKKKSKNPLGQAHLHAHERVKSPPSGPAEMGHAGPFYVLSVKPRSPYEETPPLRAVSSRERKALTGSTDGDPLQTSPQLPERWDWRKRAWLSMTGAHTDLVDGVPLFCWSFPNLAVAK